MNQRILVLIISIMLFLTCAQEKELDKAQKLYDAGNYIESIEIFEKYAEKGKPKAQFNLGIMHYKGQGISKDYKKAEYWFKKAAEQGDATAQCNLGIMYYKGEVNSEEYEKAIQPPITMEDLDLLVEITSKHRKKAAHRFKKAAEQGDATAQCNLGIMYAKGQGVSKDYKKAKYWFKEAGTKTGTLVRISITFGLDDAMNGEIENIEYGGTVVVELNDGTEVDAVCDKEICSKLRGGQTLRSAPTDSEVWKVIEIVDENKK